MKRMTVLKFMMQKKSYSSKAGKERRLSFLITSVKRKSSVLDINTESVIISRVRGPINLSLTTTRSISLLSIMTYYKNPHAHYRQDHPNIQHHSWFFLVILLHSVLREYSSHFCYINVTACNLTYFKLNTVYGTV